MNSIETDETDQIDKTENEWIWQGIGSGAMRMANPQKREERINKFVNQILSKYPPGSDK